MIRRVVLLVVVAAAVLVGVAVVGGDSREPGPVSVPTEAPPPRAGASSSAEDPGPVFATEFSQPTGTTLLVDNGLDGATAIELDTGRTVHVSLPGQRAGDQPYRLWQVGGRVVVGWDEIWAVAPGAEPDSKHVGDATVFVPDTDPRRVWLVDYAGGRVGQGVPTWTLVEVPDGEVVHRAEGREGQFAIRGVPGGLAIRDGGDALLRYDPETGKTSKYLNSSARYIADAGRDAVVWCAETCASLVIEYEATSTIIEGEQTGAFHPRSVWLSDDGSYLAAQHSVAPDVESLTIFDAATGDMIFKAGLAAGRVTGDWGWAEDQFIYLMAYPGPDDPAASLLVGRWTPNLAEQVLTGITGDWVAPLVTYPAETLADLMPERNGS